MNKEELEIWFCEKLLSCYPVNHDDYPNSIYWFYDDSFVRKIKINKIDNIKKIKQKKVKGVCLFEQDINTKNLYCDYNLIWNIFEKNTNGNYDFIKNLIQDILYNNDKIADFSSNMSLNIYNMIHESNCVISRRMTNINDDYSKLNFYKPDVGFMNDNDKFYNNEKLRLYN